jgi:DNA-binding LacI/PurR family transcriptional regulator
MVRELVSRDDVVAGERLPSTQKLAEELGVSRPTVRAALRELEQEGLVVQMGNGRRRVRGGDTPSSDVVASTVVLLTDLPTQIPTYQRNPGWEAHRVNAVTAAVGDADSHILILQPRSLRGRQLQQVIARRPQGVIVMSDLAGTPQGKDITRSLLRAGLPAVVNEQDPSLAACDSVSSDHEAGAYALTRWLADQGRRRILRFHPFHTGPEDRPAWLRARDNGHERAMNELGLEILPPAIIQLNARVDDGEQTFRAWARVGAAYLVEHLRGPTPVDALMAPSDGETFALAAACRLFGKVPGQDILISGYDDYWMDCLEREWETSHPAVTMDKQNALIGHELVQVLFDRIQGRLPPDPQHRLIPPKLVVPGADDIQRLPL